TSGGLSCRAWCRDRTSHPARRTGSAPTSSAKNTSRVVVVSMTAPIWPSLRPQDWAGRWDVPCVPGREGLTWSYRHLLPCQVEDGRGLRPAEALGEAQLHPVADAAAHHDSHVDGLVLESQGSGQAGHRVAVVFHPLLESLELVHLAPLPYSIITVVKTIHLELTTVNNVVRWELWAKGHERIEDLMRPHPL